MDQILDNTTWDNSKAYKGFDDPRMNSDLEMAEKMIPEIEKGAELFEEAGLPSQILESELRRLPQPINRQRSQKTEDLPNQFGFCSFSIT